MEYKHLSCAHDHVSEVRDFMDREICPLAKDGWTIDQSVIYAVGQYDKHLHCAFIRMKK